MDLREFIRAVRSTVEKHNLGNPGQYARWLWQDGAGGRQLGINEYGVADAANILYTIGAFPRTPPEREGFINTLRNLQDAETGLYRESTHHPLHTTAHCIAALELFDARPTHPLSALRSHTSQAGLTTLLEGLDWRGDPWHESQKGAGLYTALVLCGEVPLEWQGWYFDWLWREADPETGFWRKGLVHPEDGEKTAPLFHHLAGSFHYLFVLEYARQPLRYPDRVIDSCLRIYREGEFPTTQYLYDDQYARQGGRGKALTPPANPTTAVLGRVIGFAEVDWVYSLTRALRQSGHRFAECRAALRDFADMYLTYLTRDVDTATDDRFNDLHWLFGAMCALAELQQALPGLFRTEVPLRLVLDRRPFI